MVFSKKLVNQPFSRDAAFRQATRKAVAENFRGSLESLRARRVMSIEEKQIREEVKFSRIQRSPSEQEVEVRRLMKLSEQRRLSQARYEIWMKYRCEFEYATFVDNWCCTTDMDWTIYDS